MNQFMPLAALAGVYFISQTLWLFWALYRDMRHLDNKEIIDGWREAVSIRDKEIDNFSQVNQRLQQEGLSYKKSFESRKEQCERLEEIIKTGKEANSKQYQEIVKLDNKISELAELGRKYQFKCNDLEKENQELNLKMSYQDDEFKKTYNSLSYENAQLKGEILKLKAKKRKAK